MTTDVSQLRLEETRDEGREPGARNHIRTNPEILAICVPRFRIGIGVGNQRFNINHRSLLFFRSVGALQRARPGVYNAQVLKMSNPHYFTPYS